MTKKKILCTIISVLLLGTSICSVFAADTATNLGTATETAVVGNMERIFTPVDFDFEIVYVDRDTVTAEFTSSGRISTPPYVGEKGTKNTAEKVTNLQYVLEYDKEYSFVYTVNENGTETVYNSFLTIEREDGIKVIFGDIIKNEISDESTRAAGTLYESESNNTQATADTTYDDYDNIGALTSTTDVDWWKVSFAQAGRANFWLGNIPAGCDYDISVYNAAGVEIGYSLNVDQEPELVQLDVTPNTYYYIKIESYSGSSGNSYLFRAKNYVTTVTSSYIYYTNKGTPNYDYTNLTRLYNNGSSTSWYSRIFDQGCFVTAYAMMLRNLNKTTTNSYTDIRTGTYGRMIADPFTVTYANSNFPTITYNSASNKYYADCSLDPVETEMYRIGSSFGASSKAVDLTKSAFDPSKTMSIEEKLYWIAYYITYNPQGVGMVFYTPEAGTHIIVGVETGLSLDFGGPIPRAFPTTYVNPEGFIDPVNTEEQIAYQRASMQNYMNAQTRSINEIDYGHYFTVCDPVNYTSTPGDNVSLNDTWTATEYTLDDVISLRIFDVIDPEG